MKKICLGILSLLLCLSLCGCGTSSSASAISSLSNQLDETANTVSSVETVSPTSLGSSSSNLSSTQNALMREEWNKAQILSRTAEIKNALSEEPALSKDELSAVKELTSNLNKYTLSVAYTKNDLDSTLKSISSLSKDEEKNADKLDAKLNRLACSSNARASYYENILNTLDQIDAYLSSADEESEAEGDEQEASETENDGAFFGNPNGAYRGYNSNNINRAMYGYGAGYGRFPANGGAYGGYGTYGGYGAYGMNEANGGVVNGANGMMGGYGYGQNIGGMAGTPFNLNRNTDTYAPMFRNVDTYRPEKERLEEFEKIGDDNTLENDDEIETIAMNEETEAPKEQSDKQIKSIEPQAKVEENVSGNFKAASKLKPVSSKTDDDNRPDWDLPIVAH